MLIVNGKQVEQSALNDTESQMFKYADQYKKGIERLKKNFGDSIRFRRPNYPKSTKGIDSRGREVPRMAKPTPRLLIPLKAQVNGEYGMEIWEYCKGNAELLPNNLWKATGQRSLAVEDVLTVSLNRDPELAFFLFYKSPFYNRKVGKERKGTLIIDDPNYVAKEEGDRVRAELELQNALYMLLSDPNELRIVAQANGIPNFDKKHPDTVRRELKSKVLDGEKKKGRDPRANGIKEFVESLKVSDAMRLRHLVQHAEDTGKLKCNAGGMYTCGERDICKVPLSEMPYKQWWVANYLGNASRKKELTDFIIDVVDSDYLSKVTDDKIMFFIAKNIGIDHQFKKKEDVSESVRQYFLSR